MAMISSPRAAIAVARGARVDERVAIGDCPHGAGSRVCDDEPLRARVQRRLVDLDRETVGMHLAIHDVESLGLHGEHGNPSLPGDHRRAKSSWWCRPPSNTTGTLAVRVRAAVRSSLRYYEA